MAEEKQIGIPQEPLDYSSELATRPYELDETRKYEEQRHAVGSESLRRVVVGDDWKTYKAPAHEQAIAGVIQGGERIIKETVPQEVVKWGTDPTGAATGAVVGATGYSVGSRAAGKIVSQTASKLLKGAARLAGGVGGALGLVSLFDPTPIASSEEEGLTPMGKLPGVKSESYGELITNSLKAAKSQLDKGLISQEDYDKVQKDFDERVAAVKKEKDKLDTYNEVVDSLNGIPYPSESFADAAVSGAARYLESREELQAIRNAKKGIDEESPLYKAGNVLGNVAVFAGSAVLGNKIARYGVKGTVKRALIDEETEKGLERLAAIKPVRSRKAAQELAETFVKGTTAEIESAAYVWENARDYIERTGDTTLSEFTPRDAKTLSAAAYGAIAGEIEVMGGVEALATGAFRNLGLLSAGKAIAKTSLGEGAGEFGQNFTEYLSRRIDGTTDKTIGEALTDSVNAFVWGAFGGVLPGTIGHMTTRHARNQGVKVLQDYGLSRDTAEKVFDNMVDTVANANNPEMETIRENIRSKVAAMYEDIDMTPAEKEDTIESITDLEMAFIAYDSAENGIDIADNPILQGEVNQIGWFREGIPEQVADQVRALNNEITGLRQQLKEENAKETKDFNKIDDLEAKIEQFYAKLPKEISDLVETDRAKVRQMLDEQMARARDLQDRRKVVRQVQQRALKALQREQESDVQKSLRRLQEQTRTEEQKARAEERKQWQEQRKLRKAIEKLRQDINRRKNKLPVSQELFADADLVYQALRDSGFTDSQISTMAETDIINAVMPYGISPQILKQSDLAAENARLDDIYPEYTGETIEVDGKERTVYNSNGERIAKSKEALTNFWRWFGDSKVVDEQGRPLVVYHGTDAEFDTFDMSMGRSTMDIQGAFFSQWELDSKGYGSNVRAFYIKLENPASEGVAYKELNKNKGQTGAGTMARESLVAMGYDGVNNSGEEYIVFKPENIKSVDNRGTYSADTGNIYRQSKNRGFYIPEYRFIGRTQNMDATTLSHELAHDWMQQYFRHYRSGKASPEFMKSWGAVEKALGISPDAITVPDKASEAFARAYEGWVMNKTDWAKNIAVDDDNREDVINTMKRYQTYLTDVYNDLTNPYFKEAWGEVGELKPELKAWFDQMTLAEDVLSEQVETGKITPQQATAKIIDKIVEKSEDTFTEKEKAEIETVNRINDTSRYEVAGGNKNSLQKRLSGLAQSIDENNATLGRYETHRDMLEVARAADEFVRTRRDEAMDIINGIKPETEGLYASDLYTALERLAVENNDVDLAMELVNSKVATDLAKELGQRVAGFRNFKTNGDFDVISQLKSLDKKFKKDYEKNGKAKVEEAANEFLKDLSKADSEQDVDSFLKSIECQ